MSELTWNGEERRLPGVCCLKVEQHEMTLNGSGGVVEKVIKLTDTLNEDKSRLDRLWTDIYGEKGICTVQEKLAAAVEGINEKLRTFEMIGKSIKWFFTKFLPVISTIIGIIIVLPKLIETIKLLFSR
jgi:hypothetical protein